MDPSLKTSDCSQIGRKTCDSKLWRYHQIPGLWPWLLLYRCCPGNVADCASGGQYRAQWQFFVWFRWLHLFINLYQLPLQNVIAQPIFFETGEARRPPGCTPWHAETSSVSTSVDEIHLSYHDRWSYFICSRKIYHFSLWWMETQNTPKSIPCSCLAPGPVESPQKLLTCNTCSSDPTW